MDANGLILATIIGSVLQQAMVWTSHFIGSVRPRVLALGGMGLSCVSGGLYAMLAAGGWRDAVLGGAIAGGLSACLGIGTSVALKDAPPSLLLLGTLGAIVAGGLGALLAHLVG